MTTKTGPAAPHEREAAAARTRATQEAWDTHGGRNLEGAATVRTPAGEATIGAIGHGEDDAGNTWVEVWTGPRQGPPQFRIINPPTLVEDPAGAVEVTERLPDGRTAARRYRHDPVAAIAATITRRSSR